MQQVDENLIFEAYAELKYIEESATGKAAAARKLKNKNRKMLSVQSSVKNEFIAPEPDLEPVFKYDPNAVYLPFEDIENDPFNSTTTVY